MKFHEPGTSNKRMKGQVKVIADLCVDILVKGEATPQYGQAEQLIDDYTVELGGSAAIFATQYSKLGNPVELHGFVGKDFLGEFIIKRLQELGVCAVVEQSDNYKTPLGLGLLRKEDRAMLTYSGAMGGMMPATISLTELLSGISHLHIASYFLLTNFRGAWKDIIRNIKSGGSTISLDPNWAPDGRWEEIGPLLPLVDVFLPNEQEAMKITRKESVEEAGEYLASMCPLVVIKCGQNGAALFTPEGSEFFPVPTVFSDGLIIFDTTGAGDNFDAGFLHGWLDHQPLEDCVQLAMQCGTQSLSELGGISGQVRPPINRILTT